VIAWVGRGMGVMMVSETYPWGLAGMESRCGMCDGRTAALKNFSSDGRADTDSWIRNLQILQAGHVPDVRERDAQRCPS